MDQPLGSDPQAPTSLAAPERNQYYYGKLLDVSHLELEQNYLNGKRWLLTRLLNGTGVASGLAVAPAADGAHLIIQPGVAIDGWGREIVVPAASLPFDPRALTDDAGKPAGTVNGAASVLVSLCYQECGVNPAPMLVPSCNSNGDCSPSATREQYYIVVKQGTAPSNPMACNFADLFTPQGASKQVPDLHPKLSDRISQAYQDPSGQGCVLLAQVNLPASGAIAASMVDNTVRPLVVSTGLLLEVIFCLAQRVQSLL